MYPYAIQSVVAGHGGGFGRARVYAGEMSLVDFSLRAAFNGYFCHLFGGMLRRMACRVRPYELAPGAADRAQEEGLAQLEAAFRKGLPGIGTVREVAGRFARIPVRPGSRPKVAILGDLYARDNEVLNRELVRTIEANGGEVITTPYTEYVKNIAGLYLRRWLREGHYLSVLKSGSLLTTLQFTEKKYLEAFTPVLGPPPPDRPATAPEAILARFHLTPYQTGETFDNILNIFHLLECHPDLDLLVHTSPAFCCPSLVTEALAAQIERATGVPMVSLTYDGTGACPNDLVIPYLKLPRKRRASVPARP
jgi:predicted nucleotide-binding protein (sugar kinase/HSP70/actin superfamily)